MRMIERVYSAKKGWAKTQRSAIIDKPFHLQHDINHTDDSLDDDVAGPSNGTRNHSDRMPQLDSELTLTSLRYGYLVLSQ